MKKSILSLVAVAFVAFGFSACEDVPAPYEINNGGGGSDEPVVEGTIIDETFKTSLGGFSAINTEGTYSWACSYSCVQVTSYADVDGDGQKDNNAATSWLVSPSMNLSKCQNAHVSFDYILRYANANELKTNYQLLISKDYAGQPAQATWTNLEYNLVQGSDWETWYNSGNVNIPAEFIGQENVVVALRYIATTKSATWEVKNFSVATGEGDYNPGGGEVVDEVKTLPYEETFATSLGAFKNYTTSGEGAWVNDFSTAKATGWDGTATTAGTYYLVSPEIDLAGQTAAHVSYSYILRYDKGQENQQLYITDSFNAEAPAEGWTLLNGTHTEGSDWTTFANADLQIPAQFLGKKIRLAYRYNTNAESGSTWEVKNFKIQAGNVGEGGTEEPGGGGEVTEGDVSLTFADLGLGNATDLSTVTLSDGSTLTFAQNDGNTPPRFYENGSCARMYAKNSLEVTGVKNIASVTIVYDVFNGTSYVGNSTLYAEASGATVNFTKDEAAQSLVFSPVNARTLKIVNEHTVATGGVQLRMKSISITYVK